MAPIVVEPEELAGAGVSIAGVSDELAAALSTLAAGLPGGAMAGHDTAGLAFGAAYQQAGQALLDAGAAAANGGRKVGFGVQMSATNYSRADASSTIGGGAGALTPPSAPSEVDAPTMSSPFGGGVAEPFLWSMVEMLVGGVWPDGDPTQLRAAAGAWSTFARTLSGIGTQLQGPSATIAAQQIPEGGAMATALSDLTKGLTDIATESVKLATQTFEFAADVESAQNAIRDLLSRLSPSGIFDGLGAIFSGDAMEELREIAEDIRTVLDNLKRQADARQGSMDDVMQMIDGAVVSLEEKARKEFTDYLGEDVGNAMATTFDTSLNLREGLLKGGIGAMQDLQQLNPLRFAYDFEGAKDTWGGMLETNFNASLVGSIIDPERAADTQLEMLKGLVHAEDWTTERPGLGMGENLFDFGSAFLGGAGVARSGTRAAGEAADAAEGAAPGVRAAGALDNAVTETSGIAGRVEGIADDLDKIGDDISEGATPNSPGPAIPRDLAEPPDAPEVPDAPTNSTPPTTTPAHAPIASSDSPREGSPSAGATLESQPGVHGESSDALPSDGAHGTEPKSDHHTDHPDTANHESAVDGGPAIHHPGAPGAPVAGFDYALPASDALEILANPAAEIARLAEGNIPASILDGYDPLAGRSLEDFKHEYTFTDAHGNPQWDWDGQAPNHGFAGDPVEADRIPQNHELDRIGSNRGGFMADAGTPLAERGMPPGVATQYHTYEGTGRPIPEGRNWVVLHGPAKEAYGQPGGAEQWIVIDRTTRDEIPVGDLIEARLVRETTP